jgi:hypothetical protein
MRTLVLVSTLAGCYGSAPPRPTAIPLPEQVAGGEIDVHSEQRTQNEDVDREAKTCAQDDATDCTVTHYTDSVPITRTYSTATYAGAPITYAQLKVMTDPKYGDEVAEIDRLGHQCRFANVPRYLGLAGVIGGLVVLEVGASGKNVPLEVLGGVIGAGGIASYATGYYAFGGRSCVEARRLYNQLDYQREQWSEVEGEDYAQEMEKLAADFNARASAVGASTTSDRR